MTADLKLFALEFGRQKSVCCHRHRLQHETENKGHGIVQFQERRATGLNSSWAFLIAEHELDVLRAAARRGV